jgi:hypothetical protein
MRGRQRSVLFPDRRPASLDDYNFSHIFLRDFRNGPDFDGPVRLIIQLSGPPGFCQTAALRPMVGPSGRLLAIRGQLW